MVAFQPTYDGVALVIYNDTDESWSDEIVVSLSNFDGETLGTQAISSDVAPRSVSMHCIDLTPSDPTTELLTAGDAHWFFAADMDCRYPAPEYELNLVGHSLTVRAHTLLRDLTIFADRLHPDASVDRALVTLLPGESATFDIRSPAPIGLPGPPVLRCVNQIVNVSAAS